MADLPQHPHDGSIGEEEPREVRSRRIYVWWAGGVALVALMLVLHLAGVFGPGSH